MSRKASSRLRKLARSRAEGRCEYCLRHESDAALPHQLDHVVSRKHGGNTTADNVAWACAICNLLKGSDTAGIDEQTGEAVRLYNPRSQVWAEHFRVQDGQIIGLTSEGRLTERLLQFNRKDLVELRRTLIRMGRYPGQRTDPRS